MDYVVTYSLSLTVPQYTDMISNKEIAQPSDKKVHCVLSAPK